MKPRLITLAVLALGGQGGGVLVDWIVDLAEHAGWTAQATSVAGVAQRTGATIYYIELMPPTPGRQPLLPGPSAPPSFPHSPHLPAAPRCILHPFAIGRFEYANSLWHGTHWNF